MRLRGPATVLVTGATALCGVLMLGGVGPAVGDGSLTGERLAPIGSVTSTTTGAEPPSSSTSMPGDDGTHPSTSTTVAPSTSTTETPFPEPLSPVPLSVAASSTVIGAGGAVDFSGECPSTDGRPLGPVIVWMISDATDRVDTGVTAAGWTYRWVAPTDPDLIRSYTFQFWCGEPDGWQGGYPAELQRTIDIVAQAVPAATVAPLIEAEATSASIPATG